MVDATPRLLTRRGLLSTPCRPIITSDPSQPLGAFPLPLGYLLIPADPTRGRHTALLLGGYRRLATGIACARLVLYNRFVLAPDTVDADG